MGIVNLLYNGDLTLASVFSMLIGLAIAISVHEFAHAKIADWAGDPTPRSQGRVTLNPLAHYDPIGTTLILLFGMGWGKPVMINPVNFRRPRQDEVLVSLGGAAANLVVAVVLGTLLRFHVVPDPYRALVFFIVSLNCVLAVFNLIPLYPLDGSHVLVGLLPYPQAHKVSVFYQRYGMMPLFVFFMASSIFHLSIIGLPIELLIRLVTGL